MKKAYRFFLFVSCSLFLASVFSGCVRLTGGAGVWKHGADDAQPVSHQAGFDTADLLPQSHKTQ